MPQATSLSELTAVLQQGAASGTLLLNAQLLPQAGELAAFLAQAIPGVAIDSAVVTPGTTTVTVTGTAVLFAGSAQRYQVTLTGQVPRTTPQLSLAGVPAAPGSWTFAADFPAPEGAESAFPDQMALENSVLAPQTSFFQTLALTHPAYQVSTYDDAPRGIRLGVSLTATLNASTGPLSAVSRFLPPGTPVSALALAGGLVVRAGTYPLADLAAPIPGLAYTYAEVTLGPVALRLLSLPVTEEEPLGVTTATLEAQAVFGEGGAVRVEMQAPVLQAQNVFTFAAVFPRGAVPVTGGLQALSAAAGGASFPLPPTLPVIGAVSLRRAAFGLQVGAGTLSLAYVSIGLATDDPWNLPLPGMRVEDVGVGFSVAVGGGSVSLIDVSVTGVLAFGPPEDAVRIDVWSSWPEWVITGELREGDRIRVGDAIRYLTGSVLDVGTLDIVSLDLAAWPSEQAFRLFGEVVGDFPLVVPSILFEYFNFTVFYTPNTLDASLLARVSIAGRGFAAQANSPRADAAGWTFSGGLLPDQTFSLQDFANALLTPVGFAVTLPASVAAITLTRLEASFATATGNYTFLVRVEWTYTELGWPLGIAAELYLQRQAVPNADPAYSGYVQGEIQVNRLAVLVAYRFESGSSTIFFSITWNTLTLTASLLTKEDPETRLLVVRFPDVSLGQILEWLVGLAAPALDFKLASPWDLLNQINFKNLSLTVDLVHNAVTLTYDVNASFVFAEIKAVGVTYLRENGRGKVKLALSGRFLDTTYDIEQGNPLQWDVIGEPPPSVPARGPELIDIRYVGLGQRVALQNVAELTSVAAALKALKAQMKPPPKGQAPQNPLGPGGRSTLRFDPRSTLLFGLEVTLLRTVTLGIVLNDPRLYGLNVKLGGERAGSMAGLEFELLYRRVSDDVGVFNVVLALPEAFRHWEFGEVSITLPVIRVDVYTNGNFKVDLGFPRNGSFRDSFSVQVFPFVGYGGFYFAALNGATSQRVPRITSGSFDPVIELGIGLSVGVGKDFRLGPLSGGATLTFEVILEGCFAWYTPTDKSASTAMYYWAQGTAALTARIYGEVDFYVVSASVNVQARASATLVLEAYQPTLVTARVSVEASASVRIVFVTVHFSFEVDAEVSFTIGSHGTPPWTLAPAQSTSGGGGGSQARFLAAAPPTGAFPRLRMQRGIHRPRDLAVLTARATFSTADVALRGARRLAALGHHVPTATLRFARSAPALRARALEVDSSPLNWQPVLVLDAKAALAVELLPALTLQAGEDGTETVAVLSLYLANSVAPHARTAAEVAVPSTAHLDAVDDPGEAPFNLLLQAVLLWSIDALLGRHTGNVTLADLEQLYHDLQDEAAAEAGLPYSTLSGFLAANFNVTITAPASGTATSAAVFPLIPDLVVNGVSLRTNNVVDDAYRLWLRAYYAQLQVDYAAGGASTPGSGAPPVAALLVPEGDEPPDSLATVIFRDYFLMLARTAVQAAIDVLAAYRAVPTASDSLATIAGAFAPLPATYVVHAGDTVASIAAEFGMTVAQLEALNGGDLHDPLTPGTIVNVEIAVTPARVAEANPDAPLVAGVALKTLTGLLYQVRQGDTLASVAARFAVPGSATAAATALLQQAPNAANTLLPQPATPADPTLGRLSIAQAGTGGTYASFAYTSVAGDGLGSISAWAWVRNLGPLPDSPLSGDVQAWYAQTIGDLNPGLIPPGTDAGGQPLPIPAGTALKVPAALWNTSATAALAYAARAGDTLPLVAGYFRVLQNDAGVLAPLQAGLQSLNPGLSWNALPAGTVVQVPALAHPVRAGESFDSLAALFGIAAADLAGANAATAGVLAPLAVLAIPPVQPLTVAGDTLGRVADRYNLTLAELGADVAATTGLFQASPPITLTVPGVPMYDIGALVDRVVDGGLANQASAMVARYLLHGLRVPAVPAPGGTLPPPAADAALLPFSQAAGEQFALGTLPWTATVTTPAAWITVSPAPLTVTVDQAMMTAYGPSATFDPQVTDGPEALPFRTRTAVHYTLQAARHWQTAETVPYGGQAAGSGPAAGEPALWAFPAPLRTEIANAAAAGAAVTGALYTGPREGPTQAGTPLARWDWAASFALQVRLIPSSTGPGSLRGRYEVRGVAQEDRPRLLALWRYLSTPSTLDADATVYLLYAPNAESNNPAGLASAALSRNATVLLKTNLSTLTSSNSLLRFAAAAPGVPVPADTYAAPISSPAAFLALLWEASVTGTGGYTLSYAAADGGVLPDQLFATGATGSLTLLVLLDAQTRASNPDRTLYAFNDCAVVGDNVDAATASVFAEITVGGAARETTLQALPAGSVGFCLERTDPTVAAASADNRTRALFSLLGFATGAVTGAFKASHQGQPADPVAALVNQAAVWRYERVLSVAPLALSHPLPDVAGLPRPADDPYAGVAAQASIPLSFAFCDLFGNQVPPATAIPGLPVPVRYFDDVIGISQWPGLSAAWRVEGAPASPSLVVEMALQARNYAAGQGGYAGTLRTAAAHQARYGSVYYQLWQPDVTAWLTTSLNQTGDTPATLPVDAWRLGRFVNACLVFLDAAQRQLPAVLTLSANQTLETVALQLDPDDPAAGVAALGEANAQIPTASLFAANLSVPDRVVVAYGDTLTGLAGTATTPAALATANQSLALMAGSVAASPQRNLAAVTAGQTLAQVAVAGRVTVGGIATANHAVRGMLAQGAVLHADGAEVTVQLVDDGSGGQKTQSLDDLVAALAVQLVYVDVATLAVENETVPGVLAVGATPAVTQYVVQPGDTFTTAAAFAVPGTGTPDQKVAALATAAAGSPNLYPSGTSLDRGVLRTVAPDPAETLASLARIEGGEVKQISQASQDAALVQGAPLLLPARYTVAAGALAPYSVRAGDSLDTIATALGEASTQALADRNRQVTYLFNPGITVAISGTAASTVTVAADSLDSVWRRLNAQDGSVTFPDVVAAVGPSTTLPAAGAVLVAAEARTGSAGTLDALTTRFGVQPGAIAQANGALDGLLAAGVQVTARGTPLAVRGHDTFDTLVARFARAGVETTAEALAEENRSVAGLVTANVAFLLPPRPATLSAPVGGGVQGYGNAPVLPGTIFPLVARVVVGRSVDLVVGRETGAAQHAASEVAPRAVPDASGQLSLGAFAAALRVAFPTLEVALGRPSAGGAEQQTWAVSFGAGGIQSISITGATPSFFALRPLRTALADRKGVPIRTFDPESGTLVPASSPPTLDFQAVDLEVWAGGFLAAVESFLAPAYAAPGYARNAQAFHDVVAAKQTLAGAISAGTQNVLSGGAAGVLADATERLRQELLINLARAYRVETLVQYPARATSPWTSAAGYGPTNAPRLSGRPSVRAAVTVQADTLDTLAATYGVTAYAVALVLANVPAILRAGAPVSYGGTDYTVPANSTLVSLAAYVGAPTLEALADGLTAPQGLFVGGAVLDLYGLSVQAGQAGPVVVSGGARLPATFARVAEFFGGTLPELARANEDAPGVFVQGPLVVPVPGGVPVTVTVTAENDTLAAVAAAAGITAEVLVEVLAEKEGVLANAFVFHLVRAVPDATLSAAKTSLYAGASTVNVLVDVPAASLREKLVLDLHYEVNELEFDITTVPGTGGYQASTWLSFVLPLDPSRLGGDLGQVEVPLPLRAYPPAPTLLEQNADVPPGPPADVPAAKQWAYRTSYGHVSAAQDEVFVACDFNLPVPDPVLDLGLSVSGDPLFDALAQFNAAWPDVQTALAGLLQLDGGASDPAMAQTLTTFAAMVQAVAAAWTYPAVSGGGGDPHVHGGLFAARSLVAPDGTGTYTLRLVSGTASPAGAGFPGAAWRADAASPWTEMAQASAGASEAVYLYEGAPPRTTLQHRLAFGGLDVVSVQNGLTSGYVTRNAQLVAAAPTAPAFVYRTAEVTFTNLLIPLVQHDAPLSINAGTSGLQASLQALFTALLGTGSTAEAYTLSVGAQFGYTLLAGPTGLASSIISRLPILLFPAVPFTSTFPATLAQALTQWQSDNGFAANTGLFVLDVTVFTSLTTTRQIPILALSELVFDNSLVS